MSDRRKLLLLTASKRPTRQPPKWLFPTAIVRRYYLLLAEQIDELQALTTEELIPALLPVLREQSSEMRLDGWSENLDSLFRSFFLRFDAQFSKIFDTRLLDIGQRASKWNDEQWQKTLKAVLGITGFVKQHYSEINAFVSTNMSLVTSLKQSIKDKVETIVRSGFVNPAGTKRHEEIAKEIRSAFGVSKNRAKLIARDQISKLNGQLTMANQVSAGIDLYSWETADDARVRGIKFEKTNKHNTLDGKWCKWSDSSIYSDDEGKTWKDRNAIKAFVGIPGQDYQCRCWAKPIFEEEQAEGARAEAAAEKREQPSVAPEAGVSPNLALAELFEKEVRLEKIEHAAGFNLAGAEVFRTKGDSSSCSILWDAMPKKGGVISHNHPRSTPFSTADIAAAFYGVLAEMRVCSKQFSYVLRLPQNVTQDVLNSDIVKIDARMYSVLRQELKVDMESEAMHSTWDKIFNKNVLGLEGKYTYIRKATE